MDIRTESVSQSQHDSEMSDDASRPKRRDPLIVRTLRSPLFLVVFTWVLMAFLLAFEVSGK